MYTGVVQQVHRTIIRTHYSSNILFLGMTYYHPLRGTE